MYNRNIRIVTAPVVEPVSLDRAVEHCHAELGIEDAEFNGYIVTAREYCEKFQGRAYINQTIEATYDKLPAMPIYLPRSPAISVLSIKIYDKLNVETELSLSDFFIDTDNEPARIVYNDGNTWPSVTLRSISALKIQYTAGYGTTAESVPRNVISAMLLYISYLYENRNGEVPEAPEAIKVLLRQDGMYCQ